MLQLYEIVLTLAVSSGFYQSPAATNCSHWRAVLYQNGAPIEVDQYGTEDAGGHLQLAFIDVPSGAYSVDVLCVSLSGTGATKAARLSLSVPSSQAVAAKQDGFSVSAATSPQTSAQPSVTSVGKQ